MNKELPPVSSELAQQAAEHYQSMPSVTAADSIKGVVVRRAPLYFPSTPGVAAFDTLRAQGLDVRNLLLKEAVALAIKKLVPQWQEIYAARRQEADELQARQSTDY